MFRTKLQPDADPEEAFIKDLRGLVNDHAPYDSEPMERA